MTKANLIDEVARTTDRTKKQAEQIVDAVLEAITAALERGEKVDLRGFGSFQVSGRKERQGRNPQTGEVLTIAARNAAVFKSSKELAQRVNGTMDTDGPVDDVEHAQPSEASAKLHGDKINI
jgi:DNA-binding protein HU-beta